MKTRFASRLICAALCIVMLLALSGTVFADVYSSYYYTTAPVNVRSGPGTQYAIISSLTTGQVVIGMGNSNGWIQIYTSNNVTAYVSAAYLAPYQYADASARVVYPSCATPSYYYDYYNYNNYYGTAPGQVFAYYPGYSGSYMFNGTWNNRCCNGYRTCGSCNGCCK